ncbi:zonular occludens toxin domain-containing protein [Acinetobacter baumannii]|nr:zonular occludens toxin domain-containing protein [Acinetobacter baumannii]
MLTLISATPGSGKTLKAVELIYECLNKGYVVYSNILGLKVPGVIQISSQEDWRDLDHFRRQNTEMLKTPIAVFYDEAHEHAAFAEKDLLKNYQIDRSDYDLDIEITNLDDSLTATQKKQKIDEINRKYRAELDAKKEQIREIGTALSMHRHFGFDIFLITQSPKKLAAHILADVGTHLHLRRVFKMKRATIYEFPEAHSVVSKAVRDDAINKTIWSFPKHLFGTYTSTELDTHKTVIPWKYIATFLFIFIVLPLILYTRIEKSTLFSGNNPSVIAQEKPVSKPAPEAPMQKKVVEINTAPNLEDQEVSRIAMIIDSGTDCYAKNSFGETIDISKEKCMELSTHNNRLNFSRIDKTSVHSHSSPNVDTESSDQYGNNSKPVNNYVNPAFTNLTNSNGS